MASGRAIPIGVYVYFVGSFLGSLGSSIITPAVPFKALSMGASAFEMCVISSISNLIPIAGTLVLSSLANKYGRRKYIMVGSLLGASIVYVLHTLANSVVALILVRGLLGVFSCTGSVEMVFLTHSVSSEHEMWVLSAQQSAQKAGMLVGFFLASVLSNVPFTDLCMALSGICLCSSLLGLAFYEDAPQARALTGTSSSTLDENLVSTAQSEDDSSLWSVLNSYGPKLLISIGGLNLFTWMVSSGPEAKLLEDYYGYDQVKYARLLSATFAMSVFSTFASPFVIQKVGDTCSCIVSCFISSVLLDVLLVWRSFWAPYVALVVGWGFVNNIVVNMSIMNLILRKCPENSRDAVFALQTAISAVSMFTAPPVGGLLYDFKPFLPYAVNSAIVTLIAFLFTVLPDDVPPQTATDTTSSPSSPAIRWAKGFAHSTLNPTTLSVNHFSPTGLGRGFMVDKTLYQDYLTGRQRVGNLGPSTIAIPKKSASQMSINLRAAAGSTWSDSSPSHGSSPLHASPSASQDEEIVNFLWTAGLTGQSQGLSRQPTQVRYPRSRSFLLQDIYDVDSNEVGHGSFGLVTAAQHRKSGKMVALKRVSKQMVGEGYLEVHVTKDMFTKLLNISHPNVVSYVDFFMGPQLVYIVMERLEGLDLDRHLELHAPVTEKFCQSVMKQLLLALAHIHALQIMHRDVKLDALKFRSRGSSSDLVLYDFGHCCYAVGEQHDVVGTLLYMAPEVCSGQYGTAVDVWSAGVVFYVLLTGSFPFKSAGCDPLRPVESSMLQLALAAPALKKVPKRAQELLRGLLKEQSDERLAAKDALQQPWMATEAGQTLQLTAQRDTYRAASLQAQSSSTIRRPRDGGALPAVLELETVEEDEPTEALSTRSTDEQTTKKFSSCMRATVLLVAVGLSLVSLFLAMQCEGGPGQPFEWRACI